MNKNSSIGTLTSLTNQEGFKTVSITSVARIFNMDDETFLGTSRIIGTTKPKKANFKVQNPKEHE